MTTPSTKDIEAVHEVSNSRKSSKSHWTKHMNRGDCNAAVDLQDFMGIKMHTNEKFDLFLVRFKDQEALADAKNLAYEDWKATILTLAHNDEKLQKKILKKNRTFKEICQMVREEQQATKALKDAQKSSSASAGKCKTSYQKSKQTGHQHSQNQNTNSEDDTPNKAESLKCQYCGSPKRHTADSPCRAINVTCAYCKKLGHFMTACKKKAKDEALKVSACKSKQTAAASTAVKVTVTADNGPLPFKVFQDTQAQASVMGLREADKFGIAVFGDTNKSIVSVDDSKVNVLGTASITIKLAGNTIQEKVFICKKVRGFYLSLKACRKLNIVHGTFPQPLTHVTPENTHCSRARVASTALTGKKIRLPEVEEEKALSSKKKERERQRSYSNPRRFDPFQQFNFVYYKLYKRGQWIPDGVVIKPLKNQDYLIQREDGRYHFQLRLMPTPKIPTDSPHQPRCSTQQKMKPQRFRCSMLRVNDSVPDHPFWQGVCLGPYHEIKLD